LYISINGLREEDHSNSTIKRKWKFLLKVYASLTRQRENSCLIPFHFIYIYIYIPSSQSERLHANVQ